MLGFVRRFALVPSFVVLAAVAACGGSSPAPAGSSSMCTPGASSACVGPGGCAGGQVCSDDGTRYGACDCAHGDGGGDAGNGAGADAANHPDGTSGDDAGGEAGADAGGDASGDTTTDATVGADAAGDEGDAAGVSDATTATDACPQGVTCNVTCAPGVTTTITGKVYDPAGKNPLYGVAVFVPAGVLQPLPRGVPTGAGSCSCSALFPSAILTSTVTAADGSFTLRNVPVAVDVPLVLQIGKWRRALHVPVTACTDNQQPDRSLTLPGTVAADDTDDNMPDIAVSTGASDFLECLLRRAGIPASEYVAGTNPTGHVHIFAGGTDGNDAGAPPGRPEQPPTAGAPRSDEALWSSQQQLMPYDLALFSCEGGETYDAHPPALEAYLNAGGRALLTHFHYPWLSGPLETTQSYAAPSLWGSNLATWSDGLFAGTPAQPLGAVPSTTLKGTTTPFPKGVAFAAWLAGVGALGQRGVPDGELSVYGARFNATVDATNEPSQPWLVPDSAPLPNTALLFSFNTPVGAPPGAASCGRAFYSDVHDEGDPVTSDRAPPPAGCSSGNLSPQETALEFVLFDLSGCVIPDSAAPAAP